MVLSLGNGLFIYLIALIIFLTLETFSIELGQTAEIVI